jgi:hypothetical protein
MLEFVKDNKKVRLWYQFDSSYVDEGYEKYDFDEFHYDIDIDDAKDTIAYSLLKVIDEQEYCVSSVIVKALDELDSWECLEWFNIIRNCEDILMEEYKMDAMEYFAENHYEMTKDDYDEIQWDGRRCEE